MSKKALKKKKAKKMLYCCQTCSKNGETSINIFTLTPRWIKADPNDTSHGFSQNSSNKLIREEMSFNHLETSTKWECYLQTPTAFHANFYCDCGVIFKFDA